MSMADTHGNQSLKEVLNQGLPNVSRDYRVEKDFCESWQSC